MFIIIYSEKLNKKGPGREKGQKHSRGIYTDIPYKRYSIITNGKLCFYSLRRPQKNINKNLLQASFTVYKRFIEKHQKMLASYQQLVYNKENEGREEEKKNKKSNKLQFIKSLVDGIQQQVYNKENEGRTCSLKTE